MSIGAPQRPKVNRDPFFAGMYGGVATYYVDAPSRLARVREFGKAQCQAVLKLKGVQNAVRIAAERRLRKLQAGRS